jgi:hypothetical protein
MSDVLPFPRRDKGRVRNRRSMDAAGLLSLLLLDRDGATIPQNVRRFDELDVPEPPKRSPELLLLLFLWNELPAKKRERIKEVIRHATYERSPDPCYVQLHNLLNGGLR